MRLLAASVAGLSEGLIIGGVVSALMAKLLVLPRIGQVFGLNKKGLRLCAYMVPAGITATAVVDGMGLTFGLGVWALVPAGFLLGAFVGLLSMAIAEFLAVIPMVSKVFRGSLTILTLAVILGRATGALLYYLDTRWIL